MGAVSDKVVQEGFPEEVTFGWPKGQRMRKGLSPEIRKKCIAGRESSKGQDPKKRTSLLCFRNSERTFIYLRTQSLLSQRQPRGHHPRMAS